MKLKLLKIFFLSAFLLTGLFMISCDESKPGTELTDEAEKKVIEAKDTKPYNIDIDGLVIDITEQHGVDRVNEYVSYGVPLPASMNVKDLSSLSLKNADQVVLPAQFEALARWGSHHSDNNAPVKWLLVGFFADLPAGETMRFTVYEEETSLLLPEVVQIDQSGDDRLVIDTGPGQFTLLKGSSFNLFDEVIINGKSILKPLKPREALLYKPAGALSLVPGGNPNFSPRTYEVVIERDGPLCSVVRFEGSILDVENRALLDYIARLHFFAGDTKVRVDFTIANNQPIIEIEHGQPGNVHELGAVNSVYMGSLSLNLHLQDVNDLIVFTEEGVNVALKKGSLRLYQDSSGTDTWNNYVGMVGWPGSEMTAAPRIQSYCLLPGYQISGEDLKQDIAGSQALGWMTVSSNLTGKGLTVAVRDFWQNYPKAIEVEPNGIVTVDLFPNGEQFLHNLRVGEAKTHIIMFDFSSEPVTAESGNRQAISFCKPLRFKIPPEWIIHSGVLGPVPVRNVERWSQYENYVNQSFESNPDFDSSTHGDGFGNRTLLQVINDYGFYGWQDYGDVPLDYESFGPNQAGQMNLKYWFTYGMFMQMLRSGDERWYDLALPAAWHLADIDHLHIPESGIAHWSHGAYFGHSHHDEPGNINPNRNFNSPSVDLFFGPADLMLAYYITGEKRFADVAFEGLRAMENISQFSNFTEPVPHRSRANLIFAYIEGYRYTGDKRWMDALRHIVAETAITDNKLWLTDPQSYRPGGDDQWLSSFSLCQVMWTLGRYLDFLEEYNLPDDLGVAEALIVYADFLLTHNFVEYSPGYAATYNAFWFFDPGWDEYLEINNWALVTADALAYAYRYSGLERFMDAAELFYATGVTNPHWLDDTPEYLDTKGLVNHLNWGLVYMYESARRQ